MNLATFNRKTIIDFFIILISATIIGVYLYLRITKKIHIIALNSLDVNVYYSVFLYFFVINCLILLILCFNLMLQNRKWYNKNSYLNKFNLKYKQPVGVMSFFILYNNIYLHIMKQYCNFSNKISIIFVIAVCLLSLQIFRTEYELFGLKQYMRTREPNSCVNKKYNINKIFTRNMKSGREFWRTLTKITGTPLPKPGSSHNPQNPLTPQQLVQQTPPPVSPEKQQTRPMAIWHTVERLEEPQKGKTPPMEIDDETKLEIMNPIDYSGHNHLLLKRHDYESENFYKIYGSFTTSFCPLKGKWPIFIEVMTLEGHNKFQYLHVYDKPRLLRKSAVAEDMHFTTMNLPSNADTDTIIREYKNQNLTINVNDPL